jgi:hypothetical protein
LGGEGVIYYFFCYLRVALSDWRVETTYYFAGDAFCFCEETYSCICSYYSLAWLRLPRGCA